MALQRRMIYGQLAENKKFALMPPLAQKAYIFSIVFADDEGRLKGDTEWLRIKIFPYNPEVTQKDVKLFIRHMEKAGLITWYKVENDYFIQHPNWTKFQVLRPDRIRDSDFPAPDDGHPSVTRPRNRSKISKTREEKLSASMEYLKKIPDEDIEEFYARFDCTKSAIKSKGEDLHLWCEENGTRKRDYKAMLLKALKKDFPLRVGKPPVKYEVKDGVAVPIPQGIKDEINSIIGSKKV